jgi:hypothetical protein
MDSGRQNTGRPINKTQGRLDNPNNSPENRGLEKAGIKRKVQKRREGGSQPSSSQN